MKPPFVAPEQIVDSKPISELTLMRLDQWRRRLAEGGPKSYGARYPKQTAAILHGIEFGVAVEYEGDRTKDRYGPNLPVRPEDMAKVDAVIAADVAAGKKAGPFAQKPFPRMCISPIGAVPKKDSEKVRVIHHLSYPHKGDSVNAGVVEESFDLSGFGHAARTVRTLGKGSFLIKLDVSSAYKQIPVQREDWPLLGFKWRNQYYYERVLPFGLRSSCRLWDLYASALHFCFMHLLEISAHRSVIHYVDDFLFVIEPGAEEAAHAMLKGAHALCEELGLPLAPEKSEGPVTDLTFLGIKLDTVAMTASLPAARLAELKRLIVGWKMKEKASVKELQSLAGMLNFACFVVRPGRFFLRRIIDHITHISSLGLGVHAQCDLTGPVFADIEWWHQFLPEWNGISLLYEREWESADKIELYTDACNTGYGAVFGKQWFAGTWSPAELLAAKRKLRISMPFLELRALILAVATWGESWRGKKIIFRCDCDSVVKAISARTSRASATMHHLRLLSSYACSYGFDFKAIHVAGVANILADPLSRGDLVQFRAQCPNADPHPRASPSVPLPSPIQGA
jgi:hypothetical protein